MRFKKILVSILLVFVLGSILPNISFAKQEGDSAPVLSDGLFENSNALRLLKGNVFALESQSIQSAMLDVQDVSTDDLIWVQDVLDGYPIEYSLSEGLVFGNFAIFPAANLETGASYFLTAYFDSHEIIGMEVDNINNQLILFDFSSDTSIAIDPFNSGNVSIFSGSISNRRLITDSIPGDPSVTGWWDNLTGLVGDTLTKGQCILNSLTSELRSNGLPTSFSDLAGQYCAVVRVNSEIQEIFGLLGTIGSCVTGGVFSCAVAATQIGLFIANDTCRPSWMNACFGSTSTPVVSSPSPSNGANVTAGSSGQVLRVRATGATSGIIYYDDDSGISFSTPATVSGDFLEATIPYTSGRMNNNGTNYWYVEATNSAGTTRYPSSGNLSFSVGGSSSAVPVVSSPSPSDGANVTAGSSGQVLRVVARGATSGIIYYDDDSGISFSTPATVSGDFLEATIPYTSGRMNNNGTNYWYVEATNSAGTTRYPSSGNLSFSVGGSSSAVPVVSSPSPSDGANVTAGSSGQVLRVVARGATSGIIYYDDDSGISFSTPATVSGDFLEATIPYTSGRMNNNGTNYWYVEATNSAGTTRYPSSGNLSFSVGGSSSAVPVVSSPSPSDGANVTAGSSGQVLRVVARGATSGIIYYDDDSGISFSTPATVSGDFLEATIPYTSGRMNNNGTNYWYVEATNSAGTTRYPSSGNLSFSVGGSSSAVPVVSSPSPSDGANVTAGSSGQVLRVVARGATSGIIYYDDDSGISFSTPATVSGDFLEATIPYTSGRMNNNGTNYWYVEATNSAGTTRYPSSGNLSFSVGGSSSAVPVVSSPSPSDGANVTAGSSGQVLRVVARGATSGIIYYDDDSGISFSTPATVSGDFLEATIPYTSGRMNNNGTNYWYVEATNSAGTTRYPSSGNLSFSVSGTQTSSCTSSISLGQTIQGTWTNDCASTHRAGKYAKYYTFTLSSSRLVNINLYSPSVDTYLFLLSGGSTNGTVITSDDGGAGVNSRIAINLSAGTYTIEATTYSSARIGSFSVALD